MGVGLGVGQNGLETPSETVLVEPSAVPGPVRDEGRQGHGDLHLDPGQAVARLVALPHQEVDAGRRLGPDGGDGRGTVPKKLKAQLPALFGLLKGHSLPYPGNNQTCSKTSSGYLIMRARWLAKMLSRAVTDWLQASICI